MDEFYSIVAPVQSEALVVKKSKFIAYAYPMKTEATLKKHLQALRKAHPKAVHCCSAWRLTEQAFGYSDDGEPANSAGAPIYGQLLSFDLYRVLVVVVRYYGGINLGVGGLISAYKSAAAMALASATVVKVFKQQRLELCFEYADTASVFRAIELFEITILEREETASCVFIVEIKVKHLLAFKKMIDASPIKYRLL
ncbi:MAG: YigZ family protein [Flavobacteriaceae bacterium]|nr:YigZ family protein [Flavobacteriaceae bacterium]